MRQMKDGQLAFFYHSNCKEPGIAGIMKVRLPSADIKLFRGFKQRHHFPMYSFFPPRL